MSAPALLALLLGVAAPLRPAAQDPRNDRRGPRVLVVYERTGGSQLEETGAAVDRLVHSLADSLTGEARLVAPARAREKDLSWAEVVVVAGARKTGAAELAALLEAAAEAPAVVVLDGGVRAAAGSPELAERLGLDTVAIGAVEPAAARIRVLDQSHPVTQCVTHFRHRVLPGVAPLKRKEVQVLADALFEESPPHPGGAPAPVLWLRETGASRTAVSLLSWERGPSRELAVALAARLVEWAARRPISARLPREWVPVARLLPCGEAGALPGVPPLPGCFRGRRIAPVMSYLGAGWLLRPDREDTERPEELLDSLGIERGAAVADFGAGVGYFTLRLARRVGAEGRVYAVDIQKEMLEELERRAAQARVTNVVTVLAEPADPKLPPAGLDLVLMVDVYHELSRPATVLAKLRTALKKDGVLVLVEYRGEDPSVPIKPLHRMTVPQVLGELEPHGFRLRGLKEFLPRQHVFVFEKSPAEETERAEGDEGKEGAPKSN